MKRIPFDYAKKMFKLMGVPVARSIFLDNWYVPIEHHTSDRKARRIFKKFKLKAKHLKKEFFCGLPTRHEKKVRKIMWGDGDLRYVLEK